MSTEGGTRAVVAALTANLFIAVTKFAAWALTGASSMLAEAIHSVADSGNQALLLIGGKQAQRAATPEHPFGFGRERYIYAFIVSIVLFSVGGLFALYEAFHKYEEIHSGHPNSLLESSWWWVPLLVLGLAIVAESFSFRTAIKESSKTKGRAVLVAVHQGGQGARAAGGAAGGFRRAARAGVRAVRRRAHPDHPQRHLRRDRHGHDRAAAGRRGHHPGHRDQEPAARRVRDPGGHRPDRDRPDRRRRASSGSST